jgi:Uncharacterized conserved protein (DUF2183)
MRLIYIGWLLVFITGCATKKPEYSNIAADETVIFFNSDAYLDPSSDDTWIIPIHGWVHESKPRELQTHLAAAIFKQHYDLEVTAENKMIFERRISLIATDNERGKTLILELAGKKIKSKASQPNGHFYAELRLTQLQVASFQKNNHVKYCAVMLPEDRRQFCGKVRLVSDQGISVISDIDDTVKITQVADRAKLFENTFYKPYVAVAGMADLYLQWNKADAQIHYVSSSPWHLYPELNQFFVESGFPDYSISLKYFRFKDTSFFNIFKKGTETKPKQIREIMNQFPRRQFILIGDNGEQDPEVYSAIKKQYPAQIHKILIRNVNGENINDPRYKELIKLMPSNDFMLFDHPQELPLSL